MNSLDKKRVTAADKKALEFVLKTMKDNELTSIDAFGFKLTRETPWGPFGPPLQEKPRQLTPEEQAAQDELDLYHSAVPTTYGKS